MSNVGDSWFFWSEDAPDAQAAKDILARLVDGTDDRADLICGVTNKDNLVVAVTGCGPRSKLHAQKILHMQSAISAIARGPVRPPPDAGAHSWRAYAEFWRSEAARYIMLARQCEFYDIAKNPTGAARGGVYEPRSELRRDKLPDGEAKPAAETE